MQSKSTFSRFFYNKFPKLILKNVLVASILYIVNEKLFIMKTKIDETLNTDA